MFENVIEISSDDDVVMVCDDNDFKTAGNNPGLHHDHGHRSISNIPNSKPHVHNFKDKHNSQSQRHRLVKSPLCENGTFKSIKALPMSSATKMLPEKTIKLHKHKNWLKVGKSWSQVRKERQRDGYQQYLKMHPKHLPCVESKNSDNPTSKATITTKSVGKSASFTGIPFREKSASRNLLLNLHLDDDDGDSDSDSSSVEPSVCLTDDLPDLDGSTVFQTDSVSIRNCVKNIVAIKSFSTGYINTDGASIVKECAGDGTSRSGGNIFDNLSRCTSTSSLSGSAEIPSLIPLHERDNTYTPSSRSSKYSTHHINVNHVLTSDSSDLESPVTVVKKLCLQPEKINFLTKLIKPSLSKLSEKPLDVAQSKDVSSTIQDTQVSCTSDSSDPNTTCSSPSPKKLCLQVSKDKKDWLADVLKQSVTNVSVNLMDVIRAEATQFDKSESLQSFDQTSLVADQLHPVAHFSSTSPLDVLSSSSRHFLDVLSPAVDSNVSDTHKPNKLQSNKDVQVTSSISSSCKDNELHVTVSQHRLATASHDTKLINSPRVVLSPLTGDLSGASGDLMTPHWPVAIIKHTLAKESPDYKLVHSPKVLMSHLAMADYFVNTACSLSEENPFLPLSTDVSENIVICKGITNSLIPEHNDQQSDIPYKPIRVVRLKNRHRSRHSSAQAAASELDSYNRRIDVNEKLMFPSLQSRLAYPAHIFSHQSSNYFSALQLNTIEACSEESGQEYLCILLDQILDFSESSRPPKETRKQVFHDCILKSDEIPQTFKAIDILEYIRQKFRADLDIEWSVIKDLIDKVTISKGYGDYLSSEVINSISALQVVISHIEQELCRKDLSLPVKMRATYAYKLLSYDYAYNNLKEIVSTLTSAVTNGVYKEGRDCNIDARMQQADRDQGLHEEISLFSNLPSREVQNLLPLLQRMLSLGILVSFNMVDCAKKLAKEIMGIFVYLPTFEQKCLLLKTIVSDLLLFKATQYILENHFYNAKPCCADFPASIIDIAESYYFCTPCSSPMTPPHTSTDDDNDLVLSMTPQMEELVMLLHQITLAYLRCSQGKGYRSMRRRADLCSQDQNHYRLSALDMQALQEWPKYMEQLRAHIEEVCGQITYNMESYLMQMDCLQDLCDVQPPTEALGC